MKRSTRDQGLTTDELGLAQHLLGVYQNSLRWADRVDPSRAYKGRGAHQLRAMYDAAHTAFFDLVGRLPHKVMVSELNTTNPAPWTKRAWDERGD